jgi:hypothetical protein
VNSRGLLPRTTENALFLPYLSGIPAAGRSLDQRQLDLWLLAQHGAESHPQRLGVLGLTYRPNFREHTF